MLIPSCVLAETIGTVDTKFEWLGPDSKIVVEAFDDPAVDHIVCYLSRAKKGGFKGAIGLAEDTSDASIACRQVGPITLPAEIASGQADGDQVFKQRLSVLFKTMQVVRFYDKKRHALIYLTYSDRLIDGSPKNSISAVPILRWYE
jgi:CreA protein